MAASVNGGETHPKRFWVFVCTNVEPNGGAVTATRKRNQISFGGMTLGDVSLNRFAQQEGLPW